MNININMAAETPYSMFNLTEECGEALIDHIATVCEQVFDSFPGNYRLAGVVKQEKGPDQIMHRLDVCRILYEMLEIAETEDEKNYVLYMAQLGINQLDKVLFGQRV